MENLPNGIDVLKVIIKQLLEKIQRLSAENVELCRRFGTDSTNSHKPFNSNGYAKKTIQQGIPIV